MKGNDRVCGVISAGAVVAERRAAAGGARVQFGPFSNDDASGLAVLSAVSLEGPHLQR